MLEAIDLSCERDGRLLFSGLTFTSCAGEVVRLAGPNGSGKTSLIRILCGLNPYFDGQLRWNSQPLQDCVTEYRQKMQYFGHQTGVKLGLTPQENLRWMAGLRGCHPTDTEIDSVLSQVQLDGFDDVPLYMLSAGQKRRVALANLFLHTASLWILDEPFTAIDKGGVMEFEGAIAQHVQSGGAVIVTTHHDLQITSVPVRVVDLGQLS